MRKLEKLCESVRVISLQGQVSFHVAPEQPTLWICRVSVGEIILSESRAGGLDDVIEQTVTYLKAMTLRMRAALSSDLPPPSEGA